MSAGNGGAASGQSETLREILERSGRVLAAGARPVLLFDVDDTLLSTAGRHLRILREYASERLGSPHASEEARLLAQVQPGHLRYAIVDTARAAGLRDEGMLADLRDFWFRRFFKNEYLLSDLPVPEAPAYCRRALESGAGIVYLTGRDESMRSGTLGSLFQNGFPMPDGVQVHLLLKPRFDAPDLEFKLQGIDRVRALGTVVAGFENEPAHINLFQEAFPEELMVFVETKHSGKPITPLPQVRRIRDFSLS